MLALPVIGSITWPVWPRPEAEVFQGLTEERKQVAS